jgi:hypothetical protein
MKVEQKRLFPITFASVIMPIALVLFIFARTNILRLTVGSLFFITLLVALRYAKVNWITQGVVGVVCLVLLIAMLIAASG